MSQRFSRGPMGCSRVPCSLTSATALTRVPRSKARRVSGASIRISRSWAQPYADEKTFFRLGGFNLPLKAGEHVRLIRAFNVLRQYEEKDFAPAYERLAQYVLPGGLMIEGTSNPFGQLWTANVVRKVNEESGLSEVEDWKREALVLSTNFRLGFDVEEFQTILPKNLIHHVIQGEPIYDFFQAWKQCATERISAKTFGLRQWFIASAESLAARGYNIDLHKKWLSKGWLVWRN
jgi:hypothetical protein